MKKLLLVLVAMCMISGPVFAAMNFYRDANGKLVAEATTCQDAAHLMNLMGLPDDPPEEIPTEEEPVDESQTEQEATPTTSGPRIDSNGVQTLIQAFFGPSNDQTPLVHGISTEIEKMLGEVNFEERQDSFITFVRDVNWKTGMYMTFRDYSFFRRFKMACSGITQMTKPLRLNLETYTGSLDSTIERTTDAGINELAQAARGHSFDAMSKLSVLGLAIAIEKENPFLLLVMDEETYNKLVEHEPRIADLFEDMYMFFAIRSIRMGEYNANIKDLIRISEIGKGNSFDTWHIMSEYAKKMLELERADKLNPDDEKAIHIWRLESSLRYIKEQVRIEKRAADLAYKDPQNASLIKEVSEGPKKKPSLDDKARALLRKSTQDEIKHLIRKYKSK